MNLYHKHRPDTLKGLKGNSQVVSVMENLLNDTSKVPQSFLFHGGTGCGKTTLARIVKNSLEVSEDDYREYNSSDERGIDAIRQIINNSHFMPLNSNFKIYVLDEAHKLTNDAQNALLKILEDTPKHVIFILLTTDPDKLIKAIRGRCQQFQLNPLSEKEMKRFLIRTAKKEGDKLSEEVLEQIIMDSQGHPRNALQILEQVLNTDEDDRLKIAKQTAAETSESIELCRALIGNAGWGKVRNILKGLKNQDAEKIRRHVLGYASSVVLNGDNDKAGLVMEEFIEPFYNSGFPGLVYACYAIIKN